MNNEGERIIIGSILGGMLVIASILIAIHHLSNNGIIPPIEFTNSSDQNLLINNETALVFPDGYEFIHVYGYTNPGNSRVKPQYICKRPDEIIVKCQPEERQIARYESEQE